MKPETINPPALKRPSGFSHGLRVPAGKLLFIAGETAGSSGEIATDDFAAQFDRALANVLEVVSAAGGKAEDLMTFTIFVTSIREYQASLKPLGEIYRRRMGRHYPCMALVEVTRLVNAAAKVEIQSIAVLGG